MVDNKKVKILLIIIILVFLVFLSRNLYINSQETKALSAFNKGDYDKAINHYQSILKLDDDLQYKINIAYNYYLLEDYDNALDYLERNIDEINNPKDLYLLSLVNEKKGKTDKTLEILNEIIQLDKTYVKAWEKIGQIESKQENYDLAANAYREAIELKPKAGENYLALAMIFYKQKAFDEEIQTYLEMLDKEAVVYEKTKDESLFVAEYNLGATLYRIDRIEEAVSYFESAIKKDPDHADAMYYLASIHALLGNENKMYDYLEKAIKLDDNYLNIVVKDNDFRDFIETSDFEEFIKNLE
ncbi:MAG: tetratricopeptide repeat protein [Clostridia bacterium]